MRCAAGAWRSESRRQRQALEEQLGELEAAAEGATAHARSTFEPSPRARSDGIVSDRQRRERHPLQPGSPAHVRIPVGSRSWAKPFALMLADRFQSRYELRGLTPLSRDRRVPSDRDDRMSSSIACKATERSAEPAASLARRHCASDAQGLPDQGGRSTATCWPARSSTRSSASDWSRARPASLCTTTSPVSARRHCSASTSSTHSLGSSGRAIRSPCCC